MILKKIESAEYNIEYINKINRLPKYLNWLKSFAMDYSLSASFLEIMNSQLRPNIENRIGKKLNWNEIWLFLVPYESGLYLCKSDFGDELYYSLICSIRYDAQFINYYGQIIWTNATTKKEFDFSIDVSDIPIVFMWIPAEESEDDGLCLPSFEEKHKRINLKYKITSKFPVESFLSSMPHEGKFAITLWNVDDVEKVTNVLYQAREVWNNQTDKARETNDETLERGFCHNIAFDGIEDKVAYWYIDAGSAHDGIHEFLLKGLRDSGIKIKHVEIVGL